MKPRDYTRLTQEKITTKARKQKNTKEKYWFFSCPSRTLVPSQLDKDEV